MTGVPIPPNDVQRVKALCQLGILDTPDEERFDRVTRVARRLFDVPIALVSLVDEDRQWFKSRQGLDTTETPREVAFCAHAILGDEIFVVRDARGDPRFKDTALVKGNPYIGFYAGKPVKEPGGANVGTLCIIDHEPRDLTVEEEQLLGDLAGLIEDEFRGIHLATTDELTGLTNRRGFTNVAARALALCRRTKRPATMMLLDLDHFKEINDSLGHQAGDQVLRHFGQQLRATFRESDLVARIGGDEFCVLMIGSDLSQTEPPLENLRARLVATPVAHAGVPNIDFSAGSMLYDPDRHAGPAELLAEADALMYESKRSKH